MIDLLLSINMMMTAFVNQLLTMGLPVIDESLAELMSVMKSAPTNDLFREMQSMASGLGVCFALCIGSYECWMMILGRRAIDVMKILRILGLAICMHPVMLNEFILPALDTPGNWLESRTQRMAKDANKQVATLERAVATKQQEYMDSLRSKMSKQEEQKAAQDAATEDGIFDKIQHGIENIGISIQNYAKQAAVLLETKISEWANDIIRFIGEIIFQMCYYGILVGQRIFLSVLELFCPVMFALSIVPPWRSAWSQWISKYLTISLWGFLVYLIVYYIDFLIMYYLKSDLTAYNQLLHNAADWNNIGALGMQAIGTTCMYVVGMLAGAKILSMVPEVCSWLIPGGVSSGAGSMAAGTSSGVAGAAGAAVGVAAGAVTGGASTAASVAGAYNQSRSSGGSVTGSIVNSAISNSSIGKSFISGSERAEKLNHEMKK